MPEYVWSPINLIRRYLCLMCNGKGLGLYRFATQGLKTVAPGNSACSVAQALEKPARTRGAARTGDPTHMVARSSTRAFMRTNPCVVCSTGMSLRRQ